MYVQIHHHIPGRTRLRIAPWPSDAAMMDVQQRLMRLGSTMASANVHTRSLLVRHPETVSSRQILEVVGASELEPDQSTSFPRSQRNGRRSVPIDDPEFDRGTVSDVAELLARLESRVAGLSGAEAQHRLVAYGANSLPATIGRSRGEMAVAQFKTFPVALLFGSAILSLATGGLLDAAVTIGVVVVNAAIGFTSEDATEKLIRRLSKPVLHAAEVLRNGEPITIPADQVVPGDILLLGPGTFVTADARVTSSHELSVDESLLTGESLPVHKTVDQLAHIPANVADRINMLHAGTVVTGGGGRALVLRTGGQSEMARTRALIGQALPPRPEIEAQLAALTGPLSAASLGASALVFAFGLMRGEPLIAIAKGAIALAVAAIPEGLPAVATSTLALGAKAMERENAFVRALPAIEALGTIDTICLDKTGTLTENRMRVIAAHVGGRTYDLSPGSTPSEQDHSVLGALAHAVVLCNDASLTEGTGSATELALLAFAQSVGVDPDDLQGRSPRSVTHNRNPLRRWMATEHHNGEANLIAIKGAPDELLAMAASEWFDGALHTLDQARRQEILRENDAMAAKGLRILGVARLDGRYVSGSLDGLVWLGLVALADPIRAEAREAIETFHRAGIRTIMLTGDQSATARAVADSLALSRSGSLPVVEAGALLDLDERQIGELALRTSVFARVSPADKLRIVRGLQAVGRRVAMIGDGVNDGPALRASAVGVAMGFRGTDVAREVADIVIADDDLRALARAIARGRATNENIRTATRFFLSTNFAEVLVMLGETLYGRGARETPMELFWLNLGTDILPALGLALAEPADDVLAHAPRSVSTALFSRDELAAMAWDGGGIATATLAAHVLRTMQVGAAPGARSATFLTMALAQMAQGWSLRNRSPARTPAQTLSEKRLASALAGAGGLLALPFALPPLRKLLGLGRLTAGDVLLASSLASGYLVLAESRRALKETASGAAPWRGSRPDRTGSARDRLSGRGPAEPIRSASAARS